MNLARGKEVVEGEVVHTGWREFGLYDEGNRKCAHFCRKVRASLYLWESSLPYRLLG